jgi:hypothetical protein
MFNRDLFTKAVAKLSPLSAEQFESLFGGGVNAGNKVLAWAFMNLPSKHQFTVGHVKRHFPQAIVVSII